MYQAYFANIWHVNLIAQTGILCSQQILVLGNSNHLVLVHLV